MVQVDVFWSYGIGAGFATVNTWQIEAQHAAKKSVYEHTAFRDTLLYLACLFVPSGAFLVWSFPSWETMHVGSRDMSGWLVALFTLSNVTQGLLGFVVAERLLRRGWRYGAYLQWVLGYFVMLFILVHGWDGTGYQRFLSLTREDLVGWNWATAGRWLTGDIARSLLEMGIVVVGVMLWMMARDAARGYRLSGEVRAEYREEISQAALAFSFPVVIFAGTLSAAILASVAIRYVGVILGLPLFASVIYVLGVRGGGMFDRHFRYVVYAEPYFGRPAGGAAYPSRPPIASGSGRG